MSPQPVADTFSSDVIDASSQTRPNIFESRLALLHAALTAQDPGRILSIGAGTGIFETALRDRFGVEVDDIVEPSPNLARAARDRGLTVLEATSQDADLPPESFDTIYYHGSSFGFIPDDELEATFARDFAALRPGGRLILTDVPKESALGILLLTLQKFPNLDHSAYDDLISGTSFHNYRIHTYKPNWHTIGYYREILRRVGFDPITYLQTVQANPPYQNDAVEQPVAGFDRGNYVATIAVKPPTTTPAGTPAPGAREDQR